MEVLAYNRYPLQDVGLTVLIKHCRQVVGYAALLDVVIILYSLCCHSLFVIIIT
jgi:hypothetical protein